ncbi:DedA family protein [Paenarthrobacter aurescens]|uniref:VTT domain-containing protein n=1 Tax=Paenarthrobacter aurescens TaxID=43663 RepID=A0A4Y3NHE8_PAEAU|nr:VTT domain-containing protein [Paenarthrobacter aurescens]GEB21162.1 hypothetical protein AAU01_39170 [Paenarthrobacter aurescens]
MDQIMSLPFGVALAALFAIVMIRVNVTYWIGRGAVAGLAHTRFGNSLERPKAARAQALIQRWGPYAVVLSFLTIGLQTAINLAAGAARMPLRRYLPAAVAGSLMWALLYATIGLAALEAWLAVTAASPVGAAVGVAALAGIVLWVVVFRRRRARAKSPDTVV